MIFVVVNVSSFPAIYIFTPAHNPTAAVITAAAVAICNSNNSATVTFTAAFIAISNTPPFSSWS